MANNENYISEKAEALFKAWLKLSEDEKRDFIKEVIHFNNLSKPEQAAVVKKYEKE